MLAKVASGTTIGLDGTPIEVEVDVASRGFPTFTIVGLPSKAIDEAKDRVRTAIVNSGFQMPDSRITVNLAPADIPKEGSAFDLPIAIGILAASGMVDRASLAKCLFVGELSLKGEIRPVPGVISLALMGVQSKMKKLFVPTDNAIEAVAVDTIDVYPALTLTDVVLHLNAEKPIDVYMQPAFSDSDQTVEYEIDFGDVAGQEQAKRALEIAAAGFHNLHMKGPPGAGKTMLSRAFPSILPAMTRDEILEVTRIYSVAGLNKDHKLIRVRPFRAPHHTISRIGLIGGGSHPRPGEISLAHRGVLFFDEFAEFPRSVLEALRQPLEDGVVTIARAAGSIAYPARFLFLAASNPCPCGYLGHPKKACRCAPGAIMKYQKRLSGPLLDRIDLHVTVPPVDQDTLTKLRRAPTSNAIRARIEAARIIQKARLEDTRITTNGEMTTAHIRKYCRMSADSISLLKQAISRLSLSARSYFKIIKIATTIADLEGEPRIQSAHIAEALQYRVQEE